MKAWTCILVVYLAALPAAAQQRPLKTDDAELMGTGRIRVAMGIEFLQDQKFSLSGLEGDLTRVGVVDVRAGVGEYADFQLAGVIRDFLSVNRRTTPVIAPDFQGNTTSDFGDLVLSTRLKLAGEKAKIPAVGFKFSVQLPNASNESGLGTDETGFYASILASKRYGRLWLLGNIGLAILGSPVVPNTQADKLTYGFAAILDANRRISLVGEINGVDGPERIGNENHAQIRVGLQVRSGAIRWDAAAVTGLHRYDADSGLCLGITYEFQGFGRSRQPKVIKQP